MAHDAAYVSVLPKLNWKISIIQETFIENIQQTHSLSKRCQISISQRNGLCMRFGKKLDMMRLRHRSILASHDDQDHQNPKNVHKICFWTPLCFNIMSSSFVMNIIHGQAIWVFDIWHRPLHYWQFWTFLTFWHLTSYLNHISPARGYFLRLHMMITGSLENVHNICFWVILITFIFDLKLTSLCQNLHMSSSSFYEPHSSESWQSW